MSNYIYILQTREFINAKKKIYKIGKSGQENLKRFISYPKGSKLIMQVICSDCNIVEKNIIKLFKEKYTQKEDIGTEYFEGDVNQMMDDIYNECKKYKETNCEDVEMNEWTKDDVVFGGKNYYIKFCDNSDIYKILYLTSDCVKNGKIIRYEEYDINNSVSIVGIIRNLFFEEKIKNGELYNITTLIDLIDSERIRIKVDGFNEKMNYYDIDINFNYKNIINFSNKMVEKLDKIFYGDIILNDTFILSFCKVEENSLIFEHVRYKFFCRLNNKEKVSNDFEMIISTIKKNDNKRIGEIFDNKNNKLKLSKSALEKLKLIEENKKIHEKRYKAIIKQLKEIGKNTTEKYFTPQLCNRYGSVGLHMFINDYHNNIDGCQNLYKNVGDYMEKKYSFEIRKVCMNDELYNKLYLNL